MYHIYLVKKWKIKFIKAECNIEIPEDVVFNGGHSKYISNTVKL